MSKYCPIVNRKVIYQFCEDCEDKQCLHQNVKNQLKDTPLIITDNKEERK